MEFFFFFFFFFFLIKPIFSFKGGPPMGTTEVTFFSLGFSSWGRIFFRLQIGFVARLALLSALEWGGKWRRALGAFGALEVEGGGEGEEGWWGGEGGWWGGEGGLVGGGGLVGCLLVVCWGWQTPGFGESGDSAPYFWGGFFWRSMLV